jgi:hypothetical protein
MFFRKSYHLFKELTMQKDWYWIGIIYDKKQQQSGLTGPIPFSTSDPPGAYPMPEQWLGYETLEEAQDAAKNLVSAPMSWVNEYMLVTFPGLLDEGKVAYKRPLLHKGE